ncbi:MAG: MmgE/PrpD family protein [Chloroflexi bacterium]|nr:MmgE/PrpD family protein [Chloroflexota bacterium]
MIVEKSGNSADIASVFASHVAVARYENIPRETVEATKNSILDTLGVIMGASGTIPQCRELVGLVKEAGGKPESTIFGFGGKVPAWMAAFANGGMGHGLDYDDIHAKVAVHPSSSVVPAAFAAAERMGQVNGRDFLTAVTLGIDMACRLALGITWEHDWHLSTVFGTFACAAASGKIMGLGKDKLVNAFGIALCQGACPMEVNYGVGSDLRASYPAFTAKAGVLSACMAQRGIDGPKNSMEGRAALYPIYFKGKYDRNAIIAGLGKQFEGGNVVFKVWPACSATHPYIEATLRAVTKNDIHSQDIERITMFIYGGSGKNLCEPLEARRKPPSILDAKFSLPFTVAIAATRRKVVIADYSSEGLKDQQILEMAQKVAPKFEKAVNQTGEIKRGDVEIQTKAGKQYREQVEVTHGLPRNPVSRVDLVDKFNDCVRYSAKPLPRHNAGKIVELIMGLEEVADVGEIMRLMPS